MTTKITNSREISIARMAEWIDDVRSAALDDHCFSISIFDETFETPLSIIAGWQKGFSANYSDLLCVSKSEPDYALCIKIVVNEGPYKLIDFEATEMPVDESGEVEDTRIAVEINDDAYALAQFFYTEWERMMEEHREEV